MDDGKFPILDRFLTNARRSTPFLDILDVAQLSSREAIMRSTCASILRNTSTRPTHAADFKRIF